MKHVIKLFWYFFILVHGVENKKISNNFRPLKKKREKQIFKQFFCSFIMSVCVKNPSLSLSIIWAYRYSLLASCVTTLICISTYTGICALISTFHCPSFNVNFQYFTCNLSMFNIFVMIIINSMLTIWPTVCICIVHTVIDRFIIEFITLLINDNFV